MEIGGQDNYSPSLLSYPLAIHVRKCNPPQQRKKNSERASKRERKKEQHRGKTEEKNDDDPVNCNLGLVPPKAVPVLVNFGRQRRNRRIKLHVAYNSSQWHLRDSWWSRTRYPHPTFRVFPTSCSQSKRAHHLFSATSGTYNKSAARCCPP